ncbi:MAG TPA: hypothetical protein VIU64_11285 [Polyangia bacterium]
MQTLKAIATPTPASIGATAPRTEASPRPSTRRRKLTVAARIGLGLIFGLSGINHALGLVAMPPMSGSTALFWEGLAQTKYFFPLLGLVELAAGALLATGWMVPLGLALVAPVVVNMVLFHALLAPQGLGIAALVLALAGAVARGHWAAFRRVLTARPAPAAEARPAAATRVLEIGLGLAFLASGVAGATGHTPPPSTAGAAAMMQGLAASGYFMPLLCGVQMAGGALLVARRYVGIALLALAPVVVEILAYRLYVAAAKPGMVVVAVALAAAMIGLAAAHRRMFAPWAAAGAASED